MDDQKKIASKLGIHQSLLEAVRGVVSPETLDENKNTYNNLPNKVSDTLRHDADRSGATYAGKHGNKYSETHIRTGTKGMDAIHKAVMSQNPHLSSSEHKSLATAIHKDQQAHMNEEETVDEAAASRPQDKTGGETNPVDQGSSKEHMCAKQIAHEEYGVGAPIFGQHAEPDRYGNVAWYDVMFDHGVEERLPVTEMKIVATESHMNHKKK